GIAWSGVARGNRAELTRVFRLDVGVPDAAAGHGTHRGGGFTALLPDDIRHRLSQLAVTQVVGHDRTLRDLRACPWAGREHEASAQGAGASLALLRREPEALKQADRLLFGLSGQVGNLCQLAAEYLRRGLRELAAAVDLIKPKHDLAEDVISRVVAA